MTSNDAPEWLKPEIFEDILKADVPNYQSVQEFIVKAASAAGEHYSSTVLLINIVCGLTDGGVGSKQFFIKLPIDHQTMNAIAEEADCIEIEADVFHSVLPELQDMCRAVGEEVQFGARSYRVPVAARYILLDDLQAQGFLNADRFDGLDMGHMRLVLKKLALMHAASATRAATRGPYDEKFLKGKFVPVLHKICSDMYKNMKRPLFKCVRTFKGHEAYIEAMEKYHDHVIDEMWKYADADPEEFNVLQHGDCWTNNLMFHYGDDGKPDDVYLADLQMPHYGPPSEDLIYFIIASANYDIKIREFDYFVQYYHEHLAGYLKLLKYPKKIPSLRDLQKSIIENGICGYTSVICVMGAALLPKTDVAHFENFINDSEEGDRFKMLMYSNDGYRKHAEALLPWLHNRGAFELKN